MHVKNTNLLMIMFRFKSWGASMPPQCELLGTNVNTRARLTLASDDIIMPSCEGRATDQLQLLSMVVLRRKIPQPKSQHHVSL